MIGCANISIGRRMISAPTGQYLLRSYGGSKPPPYDWIGTVLCSGYA